MHESDLEHFLGWFSNYTRRFYTQNQEDMRNILLKERHTHMVLNNMEKIVQGLSLNTNDTLLARTIAVFHDIGRFSQYAEYKTFKDNESINHALRSRDVLIEEGVLNRLDRNEIEIILKAIELHNAFTIPSQGDARTELFVKLIRDADKVDIWRVFAEYYSMPASERASAAGMGLEDDTSYSTEVIDHIRQGRVVPFALVKGINDLKLMQLSWIFDLNFEPSFRLVKEKGNLHRIAETLYPSDGIKEIVESILGFIDSKVCSG